MIEEEAIIEKLIAAHATRDTKKTMALVAELASARAETARAMDKLCMGGF